MDSIVGLGNRITYNFVAPGATKSHTTLDNIVSLGNRITYNFVAPGATKSHTTLDNIVSLGNRITYNFVAPETELLTRSCTTLGEIVRLYNCAVADEGFG